MPSTAALLMCALAGAAFAQIPDGYRSVYITSKVNTNFVIVPSSAAAGSAVVV